VEEFRIIGTVFGWAGLTLESISREHIVKSWKRCGLKQVFDVIDADTGEADDSDTESTDDNTDSESSVSLGKSDAEADAPPAPGDISLVRERDVVDVSDDD